MTSEFEKQLDAAIEKAAAEYATRNVEFKAFKYGANLLKPLISVLIKQRNYIYAVTMDQKTASIRLKADNQELMKMIGDV